MTEQRAAGWPVSRRKFFQSSAISLGNMALAQLLKESGYAAPAPDRSPANPLSPRPPHFAPKAKNVIFLFMGGGPSQLDLFDPKPALSKIDGQPLPPSLTKDLKLAFIKPDAAIMASRRSFRQYGQSGLDFSELLPHTASCADDICMIRSMYSEAFNHHPAQVFMFSGSTLGGRPSIGSWVTYGLGSESQDLPAFAVLTDTGATAGANLWSSGFLPSVHQGTLLRSSGDPILYLSNPDGVTRELQRSHLDAIRRLNDEHLEKTGDREIESRILNYELAFRMQTSCPELANLSSEPAAIHQMYGTDKEPTRAFATNCLLARRLVERGVRFVQVLHSGWDHHIGIEKGLARQCVITDQPVAALLKDLKQRGLLNQTLVVWAGEFGRTPLVEVRTTGDPGSVGRDHHPNGFTAWVAGGGFRAGCCIGKTDELGMEIVEDKVHVHDLQATLMHCLGLDHLRVTYRYMGRNFRLTDVGGRLVSKALA